MPEEPDYNGTWLRARQKISTGKNWRGTQRVSIGGDEIQFGFRLLNEREFTTVQSALPLDEIKGNQESSNELSDDQRRLLELQRKDELTDEEREEFEELSESAASGDEASLMDHFDEEAYDAILKAGKWAIKPTEGDIEDVLTSAPRKQANILGQDEVTSMNADDVEEQLEEQMEKEIEGSPYPIKLTIGLNAFFESAQVRGNGITS